VLRILLRPRWLALHVLALVLVGVCVVLGLWQHSRYEEHRAPRQAADPATVALDSVVAKGARVGPDSAGRRVTAVGEYAAGSQLLVAGREQNGREGYLVLVPLRLGDGTAVPVVRGWAATAVTATAPAGEVVVTGRVEPAEPTEDVLAASPGQISAINSAGLVNLWPYELRDGYLVAASEDPAPTAPIVRAEAAPPGAHGGNGRAWQNAAYTIQWFFFGAFVVFMWFRMVRDGVQSRRTGSAEGDSVPPAETPVSGLTS
jgi:cytochrome oxidase assembly protein ShyY1